MGRIAPGLLLTLLAGTAVAGENLRFRGYAYGLENGTFLYTEVHEQRIEGERWLGGTIDYYAPDGARLAHKDLDFSKDPHIPRYRQRQSADGGFLEGIEGVKKDSVALFKQGAKDADVRRRTVKRAGPTTADSGFHPFLRDNFAALLAGETLRFTFIAAGRLDSYRFRAKRIGDTTFEGKPAVRFRVEPDSLLRLVADPLEITYDPGQRQLLEYRGLSNIHDPATGEPYNVRIVYPSKPPADAPHLPDP